MGDPEANYCLGFCYERGISVHEDSVKAVNQYKKASKLGSSGGMLKMGYYEYTNKNYEESLKYVQKAADLGNDEAMYKLGNCYLNGVAIEKDEAEAVKRYRRSAELGNVKSMHQLGMCYDKGYGVKKNKSETEKWYRKAEKAGL